MSCESPWATTDRSPNWAARGARVAKLTAKLRRDGTANVSKIESKEFNRPLAVMLDAIDFEVIADDRLVR